MVTSTITGDIIDDQGKILAGVVFYDWNDIGVCRWNVQPKDGQQGKFYVALGNAAQRELVHFEERRKKQHVH